MLQQQTTIVMALVLQQQQHSTGEGKLAVQKASVEIEAAAACRRKQQHAAAAAALTEEEAAAALVEMSLKIRLLQQQEGRHTVAPTAVLAEKAKQQLHDWLLLLQHSLVSTGKKQQQQKQHCSVGRGSTAEARLAEGCSGAAAAAGDEEATADTWLRAEKPLEGREQQQQHKGEQR